MCRIFFFNHKSYHHPKKEKKNQCKCLRLGPKSGWSDRVSCAVGHPSTPPCQERQGGHDLAITSPSHSHTSAERTPSRCWLQAPRRRKKGRGKQIPEMNQSQRRNLKHLCSKYTEPTPIHLRHPKPEDMAKIQKRLRTLAFLS